LRSRSPYRTPTTRREALELALRWIDDANHGRTSCMRGVGVELVTSFRELVDPVLDNLFRALCTRASRLGSS